MSDCTGQAFVLLFCIFLSLIIHYWEVCQSFSGKVLWFIIHITFEQVHSILLLTSWTDWELFYLVCVYSILMIFHHVSLFVKWCNFLILFQFFYEYDSLDKPFLVYLFSDHGFDCLSKPHVIRLTWFALVNITFVGIPVSTCWNWFTFELLRFPSLHVLYFDGFTLWYSFALVRALLCHIKVINIWH